MQKNLIAILVILSVCCAAHATLIERGEGLIYDDVLDITWLQDAGLGGTMGRSDAQAWVDNLIFAGLDDWRLPSMVAGDIGYSPECIPADEAGCRENELGYMYYFNLGGEFGEDLTGNHGLIQNLQSVYWSSSVTDYGPDYDWVFVFENGGQTFVDRTPMFSVWAVRSGDVPSQIPEPGTLAILCLGLVIMIGRFYVASKMPYVSADRKQLPSRCEYLEKDACTQ